MTPKREFLSIVVPIFNEEENLPELRRRLKNVVEQLRFAQSEVLLVSDGSADRSEAMIRSIVAEDPLFKGIFLTRNFGHQAAVSVGLAQAKGSVVVVIDGDLQDPPEAIPLLVQAIDEGADVAYAVRKHRKENALKKNRLLRLLPALAAAGRHRYPFGLRRFLLHDPARGRRHAQAARAKPLRSRPAGVGRIPASGRGIRARGPLRRTRRSTRSANCWASPTTASSPFPGFPSA